jgi:hypothetical protein
VKSLRGLPTSRAYWELRAEQMMNRIFEPEPTIDVDSPPGEDAPETAHAGPATATATAPVDTAAGSRTATASPAPDRPRRDQQLLLFSVLGGVCMVSAASSALYLGHWNRMQQSLRQERNLLMMERLRELGPAPSGAAVDGAPTVTTLPPPSPMAGGTAQVASPGDDLPPPPPEEPWMAQLDQLPASEPMPVLQVPVSPQLAQPAPAAAPQVAAAGPAPQLLGVVAAPGKAGSAIFQVGGATSNVGVGESIGASGWRLRSAEGDGVLIERAGQVRRLSIGSGP